MWQNLHKHLSIKSNDSILHKTEISFKLYLIISQRHNYIHLGYENYPYPCKICPKKFVSKHTLKIHQLRHDGIKKHICPICGVPKTTTAELKHHVNTHSTEKTFKCENCSAAFTSLSKIFYFVLGLPLKSFFILGNLKAHNKKIHLVSKPFICTYCGQHLKNAKTFKHHTMLHTGEKPHVCTICEKRFIQKIGLKLHLQTHMKQNEKSASIAADTPK